MTKHLIPVKYLSYFDLDKYSLKRNKILLAIFVLLTVQYMAFYYINEGILPRLFLYVFYSAAMVAPLLLMTRVKIEWGYYSLLFVAYFFFILINSLLNLSDDFGEDLASITIYLALITGMLLSKYSIYFLYLSGRVIAVIGLIGVGYILFTQQIDLSVAINRGYTWTEIFFYGPLFWGVIPFTLITFLRKQSIPLALLYWGGAVVLNLIFLKRFILVDSALLIIALIWIQYLQGRKITLLLRIIGVVILVLLIVTLINESIIATLFNATTERLESTSEQVEEFDRWVETSNYLKSTNFNTNIIGEGFASVHYGLGKSATALHIGWSNLIFKGGIILLIFVLFVYLKIFGLIANLRYHPIKVQFSIFFLLVYFFRLFYVNMHNLTPELMLFSYSLFTIVQYKGYKEGQFIQSLRETVN